MNQTGTVATNNLIGALDIGGTKILGGIIDAHTNTLLARQRIETQAAQGAEGIVQRSLAMLHMLAQQIGSSLDALKALGCSVPGPLDRERGIVHFSPNLGWHDVPFVELLRCRLNAITLIFMDDDARCAALGEARMGAARGVENAVYITVSTGIGSGVIVGGRLYRGSHGVAGEVGHITLEANGPRCACGNLGCFEALASGSAIASRAREAVQQGQQTVLAAFRDNPSELTAEQVMLAAGAGDAVALRIVESAGAYLGAGLAAIACAYDPEMIVVGGGAAQVESLLMRSAHAAFLKRVIAPLGSLIRIVPAALGDESGLWGAAALIAEDSALTPVNIEVMRWRESEGDRKLFHV